MRAVARQSLEEIASSGAFIAALLLMIALSIIFGWDVGSSVFDTSTWPVTTLLVAQLLNTPLVPITFVLIAVYAGELVWKDRAVGVAEITDAAPVPESAALAGRFLALVALLAMLQAALMLGGILLQALKGYYHFEVGLYVRILFGLNLPHLVVLAALAMTTHVVVNHKYLGHLIVVIACILPVAAFENGIVRHHLLLYGTDPGWRYSDMNGFGPFIEPIVWFTLYWAAWALLLAVIASVLWVRGRETGMRRRFLEARARFEGSIARTAAVTVALILIVGAFIFYNTNILNAYRTPQDAGRVRAEYEKRYSRYENLPQPTLASADVRVEIHPHEPAVDVRGTYRLINQTAAAIESVHIVTALDIEASLISFDRAAKLAVVDDDVNYRIYTLERVLAPGDSLQLAFDVSYRRRGFTNDRLPTEVAGNGAYFGRTWLPFIGYQPVLELSDDEERRRLGLEPQPRAPSPHDVKGTQQRWSVGNEDVVQLNAIVGTAADQIAVMPGALRNTWVEQGRRYFHYESDGPISFAVFSAKYAVIEDRWNDVALRIFYHPRHRYTLDRIVRSMKASLDYYTKQFGPYPYRELRIVESPGIDSGGRAHLSTIAFAESVFLSRVRDGEIDQPFYGTAHEIAHQWWGGQVRGATGVRGAGFISESLANYSAMMVTEKTYGPEVARRVYDFQMLRYLTGRAFQSREVPLLEVEEQPYIAYRKGAIAMYTLREHIGEERVNAALRRFFEKYRNGKPPYPTSLDLYSELRAATPESLHGMLEDWFEEITLWDLRTTRASVERIATGDYHVTIDVVARKMRADSVGKETEAAMDELIEIGIFAPGEGDGEGLGEPLHLQRHRVHSGEQTIRITVPREPARAGIDPYRKLIDRKRDDNVTALIHNQRP